jgi:L-asparaginase / beta-aspartyl-peptidase
VAHRGEKIVPVVVVHGGAGEVARAKRAKHVQGAKRAAEQALALLVKGASALDAAVRAVEILENDPVYNAGTGACLTDEGTIELDASVMEGRNLDFGAIACLPPFKNPVHIARSVLEDGKHTFYAAEGARRFALAHGYEPAEPKSMITSAARKRLQRVLAGRAAAGWAGGTVGAVACSTRGEVAAATSTGGMVGKKTGRIGDTPLPGAGTWADDRTGACSSTGIGERIMRYALARHVCELMGAGVPTQVAADAAIAGFADRVDGRGGIIVVSPRGEAAFARNTSAMSYAIARAGSRTQSGI